MHSKVIVRNEFILCWLSVLQLTMIISETGFAKTISRAATLRQKMEFVISFSYSILTPDQSILAMTPTTPVVW